MHLFFEENLNNDIITLSKEESMHCARVLRLKQGQQITFTDGRGGWCKATLLDVNPRSTTAAITQRQVIKPREFHLHMAVAPTKNIDRFEWFLEKATECGVEEITPLICEHSERTIVKPERLNKILLAALKQSQRAFLPRLNDTVKFKDFIGGISGHSTFIAWCGEGEKKYLRDLYAPGNNVTILIGPEGDFSDQEVKQALDKGAKLITLGESRLRTETAALVACLGINFLNKEF